MNAATIGGLCLCAVSVLHGQAENTPVIKAEVIDGQPKVQASVPSAPPPVAVPKAKAAEPEVEPSETPAVKKQHVVRFYEYEPKKRKRGLVEKLFKKLGSDAFEDEYAGTIIVEKMVPSAAVPEPATTAAASTEPVAPSAAPPQTASMASTEAAPSTASPPPAAAPVSQPQSGTKSSAPLVAVVTTPTEAKHGKDYTWIQGRLQKVHVRGGAWIVRYAPLDKVDEHGGSVVLVRDRRLDDFQEGDFVHIDGEILQERASAHLGGPLYRIHHIALLQAAATDRNFK